MKTKRFFSPLFPISSQAVSVLLFGLPVLLAQLGYIAFDILYGTNTDLLYTIGLYQNSFEYIMIEITLLILGAFVFDAIVRDCGQNV